MPFRWLRLQAFIKGNSKRKALKPQTFYSLYGHLKTPHKVQLGQELVAGQELGKIGKESDSGGWFCHLHLQIITQKAMNAYSELYFKETIVNF